MAVGTLVGGTAVAVGAVVESATGWVGATASDPPQANAAKAITAIKVVIIHWRLNKLR